MGWKIQAEEKAEKQNKAANGGPSSRGSRHSKASSRASTAAVGNNNANLLQKKLHQIKEDELKKILPIDGPSINEVKRYLEK